MRSTSGAWLGTRRWILIGCVVALVGGCDTATPTPTVVPPNEGPSPSAASAAPGTPDAGSPRPSTAPGPGPGLGTDPSAAAGLVLAEVLFDPRPGATAFVEIANAGSAAIDLTTAALRAGGRDLPLGETGSNLPPGSALVVRFDGQNAIEGAIVHAPAGVSLAPSGGGVDLIGANGARLDHVAWGSEPDAVSSGPGGIVPDHVAQGSTIGRPPGASAPMQRLEWVVYGSADASPGAPNPLPRVEILLPLDGAIVDEPEAVLSWYPVVGAAAYRIQVAAGSTFGSPLVDATVSDPAFALATLQPGSYRWRVASVGGDELAAPFSEVSGFELEGPATAMVSGRFANPAEPRLVTAAATLPVRLSVPYLTQHKDTGMLLLESPVERGAHAWDVDHGRPSWGDPADTKNCAIAAVAIMNRHFGGDMSQDRLGYEVLHGRQAGPELDLMFGTGLTVQDATTMLNFALGGGVTVEPAYFDLDDYWRDLTTQIDAGRPVMAANSRHTFVITGYTIENNDRIVYVHDPANGRYRRNIDASNADPNDQTLWITPDQPVGRDQEPGVTKDSDGDGVVDFDETERFGTNPADDDSDGDKLKDKADIVTGVFDPSYGYAFHSTEAGRDFDADGIPTERDKDSDAGDCWDGEEDTSGNGHRGGSETYNFDHSDDTCMKFRVKIRWSETYGALTDTFNFEGLIDTVDPNALGDVLFMTGTGTVQGSRLAWAACSVNIDAPSGTVAAFFGATIIDDKVTIGAFASEGVLLGVNTRDFEMPKDGGTQYFSGGGGGDLCPYSWAAKVEVEAILDH